MVNAPNVLLLAGGELLADVTEWVTSARMSDRAWHNAGTLDLTLYDPESYIRKYLLANGAEAADFAVIVDYAPYPPGTVDTPVVVEKGRWSGRVDSAITFDQNSHEVSFQAVQDNVLFDDIFLAPTVGRSLTDQVDKSVLYSGHPTKLLAYILSGTIGRDVHGHSPIEQQQTHAVTDPETYDSKAVIRGLDIAVARGQVSTSAPANSIAASNYRWAEYPDYPANIAVLLQWQSAAELLDEVQRICGVSARIHRVLPGGGSYQRVNRPDVDFETGTPDNKYLQVGRGGVYIEYVAKHHLEKLSEFERTRLADLRIPVMEKAFSPRVEYLPGGAPSAVSVSDTPSWVKKTVGGVRDLAIALVRASQGDTAADAITDDQDVDKILGTLGGIQVSTDTTRKRRHAHVGHQIVDGVSADEVIQGDARRNTALYESRPKATLPDSMTAPEWVQPGKGIWPGALVTVEVSNTATVTDYCEEITATWGKGKSFEWSFSLGRPNLNVLDHLTTAMTQVGRQLAATGRVSLT